MRDVLPVAEEPGNSIDDDCDGDVDEPCVLGEEAQCATSPQDLHPVCAFGTTRCEASGTTTAWGDCIGEIRGESETLNGTDSDCDGFVDNEHNSVPAIEYDGEQWLVTYSANEGMLLQRLLPEGDMAAPPVFFPREDGTYAVAQAAWNPVGKELALTAANGSDFLVIAANGEVAYADGMRFNTCAPSRLEWTGTAFVAAFAGGVGTYPTELLVKRPGGPMVRTPLDWLETGHCRETVQVAAESDSVLGVVYQVPSSPNPVSRPGVMLARIDYDGNLLGEPMTLFESLVTSEPNPAIVWANNHYVVFWTDAGTATLTVVDSDGTLEASATLPFQFANPPQLRYRDGVVRSVAWTDDNELVVFWWDGVSPPESRVVLECEPNVTCAERYAQLALGPTGHNAIVYTARNERWGRAEVFFQLVADDGARSDGTQISPP